LSKLCCALLCLSSGRYSRPIRCPQQPGQIPDRVDLVETANQLNKLIDGCKRHVLLSVGAQFALDLRVRQRVFIIRYLALSQVKPYYEISNRERHARPLGRDYGVACGEDGNGRRAAALNALFKEWQDQRRGLPVTGERAPIYGAIRWLFQEYRRSKAYTEKISLRPLQL
jgi:hypothetical protein